MKLHTRFLDENEMRTGELGEGLKVIEGYAARFGVESTGPLPPHGFVERIERGAFKEVLKSGEKISAYYQHNTTDPGAFLGSTRSNLEVSEDSNGLRFELKLDQSDSHQNIGRWVERGDITQMSFGFLPAEDGYRWERGEDGATIFVVERVGVLREISFVHHPAYEETSAFARHDGLILSGEEWKALHQKWEQENPPVNLRNAERERELLALKH